MIRYQASILLAGLLTGAMLSGCSKPSPATAASNASTTNPVSTPAKHSDIYRFKIGTLDAVALKDGDIDVANDGKTFAIGQSVADVSALLGAAGLLTDVLHLSIQPLLVRDGARVLLFDTGAAGASFARAGRLPASLHEAGVEPAQVTDIFISHRHDDHIGGLVARQGGLAFPNAVIHISAPEWEAFKSDEDKGSMAIVAAITPKVVTFQPGAVIVPGVVTAVEIKGHTPGHSGYEIASGSEHLLYVGDMVHHSVISVQRPEWTVQYDENAPLAQASRRAFLQRATDDNLRLYAVHLPFPGLGHVKKQGDGFAWVAETP